MTKPTPTSTKGNDNNQRENQLNEQSEERKGEATPNKIDRLATEKLKFLLFSLIEKLPGSETRNEEGEYHGECNERSTTAIIMKKAKKRHIESEGEEKTP